MLKRSDKAEDEVFKFNRSVLNTHLTHGTFQHRSIVGATVTHLIAKPDQIIFLIMFRGRLRTHEFQK